MKIPTNRAFTLIEMVAVVMIVGVLAGILIPQLNRAREKAMDRQAHVILKAIRAAERSYRMGEGAYWPPSGSTTSVSSVNTGLNLDLADDGEWDYCVTGAANTFTAVLSRSAGGFSRSWWITESDVNATPGSGNFP